MAEGKDRSEWLKIGTGDHGCNGNVDRLGTAFAKLMVVRFHGLILGGEVEHVSGRPGPFCSFSFLFSSGESGWLYRLLVREDFKRIPS